MAVCAEDGCYFHFERKLISTAIFDSTGIPCSSAGANFHD
jgi:hypothetical protein